MKRHRRHPNCLRHHRVDIANEDGPPAWAGCVHRLRAAPRRFLELVNCLAVPGPGDALEEPVHDGPECPTWTLPLGVFILLGLIASIAAFTGAGWLRSGGPSRVCGALPLGWAVTIFKVSIAGYRPDFHRCWPDGNVAWASPGVPACTPTNPRHVIEGRKSFPSGHSSMSFSGLAYAAAYATAKLEIFSPYDYGVSGVHPRDRASMLRMAFAWWPLASRRMAEQVEGLLAPLRGCDLRVAARRVVGVLGVGD